MATLETFGLNPDVCSLRGYQATGSTAPSYDEVEEMIREAAEEICALMDGKGISYTAPATAGTKAPGYRRGRAYVKARVRSEWIRETGQEESRADRYAERADAIYEQLENNAPLAAGTDAGTDKDDPDIPYHTKIDSVYDGTAANTDTGPITTGRRMVANREL